MLNKSTKLFFGSLLISVIFSDLQCNIDSIDQITTDSPLDISSDQTSLTSQSFSADPVNSLSDCLEGQSSEESVAPPISPIDPDPERETASSATVLASSLEDVTDLSIPTDEQPYKPIVVQFWGVGFGAPDRARSCPGHNEIRQFQARMKVFRLLHTLFFS
jgi:hypothetical protein